ncbi:HlyD family type I secretion periplasmic adaptor subunit [Flocculibacter collagenilyticus]|uniref:HlyD family type I secretion periplasmic adaptor subunit n=1 Tax=Flocculibacter collagenilyticus TaxID=2744479 RepID=UPI0018F36646|nr:HlyD family type I secretion periplasmic adaptor subunit [Flocculibacter collagenilyticus]
MNKDLSNSQEVVVSQGRQFSPIKHIVEAWKTRGKIGDNTIPRKEAAFMPAALEIQHTPPRPIARWIIYIIIALFIFVIVWACLGRVNIVAVAEGQVISSTRIKEIQPFDRGVVSAIHVKEGDYVKAGDLLISLDRVLTKADVTRLQQQIRDLDGQIMRNEAMLLLLEEGSVLTPLLAWQSVSENRTVSFKQGALLHQQWLSQQWMAYQAERQALQLSLQSRRQDKLVSQQVIAKWQAMLPLITQRVESLSSLAKKQMGAQNQYLELEQQRIEIAQSLAVETAKLNTQDSAIAEAETQLNLLTYRLKTELLGQLNQFKTQHETYQQDFSKAQELNAKQSIRSPVDGVVQQLLISTVGGVVTPAQQLMLIVPEQDQLIAEVFLENKDIGFVQEGQAAEVKLHTFPFTKYGVVHGEVTHISDDAIQDEKRGAIFAMQVRLKEHALLVEGKEIKLKPGMTLSVEVQTGKRRLIEFFLAPLLRYKSESIRER